MMVEQANYKFQITTQPRELHVHFTISDTLWYNNEQISSARKHLDTVN